MNLSISEERYESLRSQKDIFVKVVFGLLALNVLQAIERLSVDEKIVMVPPELPEKMWIKGGAGSESYLSEWSLYLSGLLLNTSPASCEVQGKILLKYVHPSFEAALVERLAVDKRNLLKNNASTTFHVKEITVDGNKITLSGLFSTYVGQRQVSSRVDTYELTFKLSHGRVLLMSLTDKESKDIDLVKEEESDHAQTT